MTLNLSHNIVVLDEAHNIEDCAREAASCSLTADELVDAKDDIDKLSQHRLDCEQECRALVRLG